MVLLLWLMQIQGYIRMPVGQFNPEDIDEYLKGEDMALYNKAIQVAYPPGSLFKIVVLLTALEEIWTFK